MSWNGWWRPSETRDTMAEKASCREGGFETLDKVSNRQQYRYPRRYKR